MPDRLMVLPFVNIALSVEIPRRKGAMSGSWPETMLQNVNMERLRDLRGTGELKAAGSGEAVSHWH